MAALYEGFTLSEILQAQNGADSGIQGIELDGDSDHVVVTDSTRSVTLYKVSDQKPLGSWTVKQGQVLTSPAVFNSQTKEFVAVSDNKVIRVWKEEEIHLDKAFKATVTADIWRVHSSPATEPVVLFQRGAVRLLDSLLSAPQQPIEDVLAEEEVIRWSMNIGADSRCVIFATELRGENFVYVQRFMPNTLQKYRLEQEGQSLSPLSFSATLKDEHISLLFLYPNGCVYQSAVAVRGQVMEEGVQALPRSLLLRLPVGEGQLGAASAVALDEAHVAVVGVPHPSAGAGKDFLCIWNTNFQTLQAGKEMSGKIYGQLWNYFGRLFIRHGKSLSVVPYECQKSSLAAALGKLSQTASEEFKTISPGPSWTTLLQGDQAQSARVETRKSKITRKSQSSLGLSVDQALELIKTAPVEEVQKEVEALLFRGDAQDLQSSMGTLACHLVARCQAEPAFYTPGTLAQLVHTLCLSHSVCPDLLLLALEKKDYFLCQLCLQLFPDVPEAITCACLKTFISVPDGDAEMVSLEPDSVSFMEALVAGGRGQGTIQNGFSPAPYEEDSCDAHTQDKLVEKEKQDNPQPGDTCPIGLHKAVLLNEVLQTPYSDNFLLPHLKDLTAQQVILFLQYLQFLYVKYSQDAYTQMAGLRSPTMTQIMDWVCLLLDAHFTVLVMAPESKGLLLSLHSFVKSQVRLFSELGKIEGSLQELHKMKASKDVGQYSIEVIELF
ncbi:nucleolar protein 11-like [Aplochiton taeniatus]